MANGDDFGSYYKNFMEGVRQKLEGKLGVDVTGQGEPKEIPESSSQLLSSIFDPLLKEDAVKAVEVAASRISPEGRMALGAELRFLACSKSIRLEDARTAKDSIERLLGGHLPDWIKEPLDVLNEILKIMSGKGDEG